jgi:hypothetical protein
MSNTSTISNQMPTDTRRGAAIADQAEIRYPIATKTAPSRIEVPSMEAKAYQLAASTEAPVTASAAAPAP